MKLAEATLALARELDVVRERPASADGAAGKTTLVDKALRMEADELAEGTIWFVTSSQTPSNAGLSRKIDRWANGTFTFLALPSQTKAADIYACAGPMFPRHELVSAINTALTKEGAYPQEDATLTTIAYQEDYTLPTGVFGVINLEVACNLVAPYGYVPHRRWIEIGGKVRFLGEWAPIAAGYKIRLTYKVNHTTIYADTDLISDYVNPTWLTWAAVEHARRTYFQKIGQDDKDSVSLLNEAKDKAKEARRAWRDNWPQPMGRLGLW
jgi:hypothetical protein